MQSITTTHKNNKWYQEVAKSRDGSIDLDYYGPEHIVYCAWATFQFFQTVIKHNNF